MASLRSATRCSASRWPIENPAKHGEHRVFNQFEEVYGVNELAEQVRKVGTELGLDVAIRNVENPRNEAEEHYYNPDHKHLLDLGYEPTTDMEAELRTMFKDLMKYRGRIDARREALRPDIRWDGSRRRCSFL